MVAVKVTGGRGNIKITLFQQRVPLSFNAEHQLVHGQPGHDQPVIAASPVGTTRIAVVDLARINVITVVAITAVEDPELLLPAIGLWTGIRQFNQSMLVHRVRARLTKGGQVRGVGQILVARTQAGAQAPVAKTKLAVGFLVVLAIKATRPAIAACVVELGKVEIIATRTGGSKRKKPVVFTVNTLAGQQPQTAACSAARISRQPCAIDVAAIEHHGIDNAEQRIGAINRGRRSRHELQSLDPIDLNRRFIANMRLVVKRVIAPRTVGQQENTGVVIAGTVEAAHPEITVVAVVADIETRHRGQRLGQIAVAVAA